jgi:hypothetical protein
LQEKGKTRNLGGVEAPRKIASRLRFARNSSAMKQKQPQQKKGLEGGEK